jgi:hypothetical protein
MEKHFEFTATKQGDAVKRLDIEVLATLAGGEQLCAEQEQALTSLEPELAELKRDSVTLDALAKHVCAVLKARPLEPDAIIAAGNADTGDATAAGGAAAAAAAAAGGVVSAGNMAVAAGNAAAAAASNVDAASSTAAAASNGAAAAVAAAASSDDSAGGAAAAGGVAAGGGVGGATVTGAAMRVQGRLEAKEQREREIKQQRTVMNKLGGLLLDDDRPSKSAEVKERKLDGAFMQYNQFLTASPTALSREWKTGQSVMRAMWELHGQDEEKIFSAIRTRKGIELYVDVVENLSGDNMRKVSARKIAVEWNARIAAMTAQAKTEDDKRQIQLEYGFIGEKEAKSHTDRLNLRVDQTQKHASMVDKMIDFCRDVKESRTVVGQLEHPVGLRQSMELGVSGPGACVLEASALRPPRKRAEAPGVVTEAETKNTCFLCSTNGRSIDECCIKDGVGEYTFGHGRNKAAVTCTWFDEKFPAGDAEANALRASKTKDALRLRRNALLVFNRAKKKLKKSAVDNAAGEPS